MAKKNPDQSRDVRAAMERLLNGTPQTVHPASLNLKGLAQEAGVSRPSLYRQYKPLADEFLQRVEHLQSPDRPTTPQERAMRDELDEVRAQYAELEDRYRQSQEAQTRWKEAATVAFRTANAAKKEARRLYTANVALHRSLEQTRAQLTGRPTPHATRPRPNAFGFDKEPEPTLNDESLHKWIDEA
ncbi:hypothetical protein [Nocardioides yefusunii]|uniref:TetR family transcriptional regulator n=1 Tax=Nocardioides yefusunii TaxID=2500546 RepID=A0ABW1R462_9ACTN|nr:hypothetical protein [Nocardioides yefusunii]